MVERRVADGLMVAFECGIPPHPRRAGGGIALGAAASAGKGARPILEFELNDALRWSATQVVIPVGVTSLVHAACAGCRGLTKAAIPSHVTLIPTSAFECCEALVDVTIAGSVTAIEERAFYPCTSLPTVQNPIEMFDMCMHIGDVHAHGKRCACTYSPCACTYEDFRYVHAHRRCGCHAYEKGGRTLFDMCMHIDRCACTSPMCMHISNRVFR
jgi:hypothetical protein